jgi:nucleoside-diphosphate-sugar epimerase
VLSDSVYGTCKHALDLLIRSVASQVGLSAAWGRIFFAYGPREHPQRLVSSMVCSLLKGLPARCSHGRQIRDYMHVQDISDALVALLDSPVTGPVNISSGLPISIREIVLRIGHIVGRPELIQMGAILPRVSEPPLIVGENRRLVAEVGWKRRFDLESGLNQTIEWWRGHLSK